MSGLVALDVDDEARGVPPVAPVAIPRARARPPHAVERDVHPRDDTPPRGGTFCHHGTADRRRRTGWSSPSSTEGPTTGRSPCACTASPTRRTPGATCSPSWPAAGFRAVAPFLRGYAPTAGPGGRPLPGGGAGAGRQRAARGARRRRRRRPRRARLGGAGHLRRGGAPTGPLASRRHARPSPRRRPSACRCSPTPSCSGAGTCSSSSPRWPRSALPLDDYAFIDGLWRDWSPGYDGAWDVARVKESIGDPEHIVAAIGYYRAM